MARKTIFTKDEDKEIKNYILKNPGNIKKACRELSVSLNKNELTILNRWYKKLSKDTKKSFVLFSRNTHSLNRKNTNKMLPNGTSMWYKLISLIITR